jgi:hypothetical protein
MQIAELPKSMELRLRPVADNAALPMHDFRYENQAGIITAGLECWLLSTAYVAPKTFWFENA